MSAVPREGQSRPARNLSDSASCPYSGPRVARRSHHSSSSFDLGGSLRTLDASADGAEEPPPTSNSTPCGTTSTDGDGHLGILVRNPLRTFGSCSLVGCGTLLADVCQSAGRAGTSVPEAVSTTLSGNSRTDRTSATPGRAVPEQQHAVAGLPGLRRSAPHPSAGLCPLRQAERALDVPVHGPLTRLRVVVGRVGPRKWGDDHEPHTASELYCVPGSHIVRVRLFWTRTAGPAVGAAIRGSAVSAHPVLGETGSDSWPQRASTPRKSRVEVDSYRFAGRCMLASSLAAAGAPVGPGT